VAICVGLLAISREKWNTQGEVGKFLSDNAFAVYVFHPPIVILIARATVELHWPPLVKALMLTGLAATASFAASALFLRRIPLLRGIL
jgi:glucan biosynthesis protein C